MQRNTNLLEILRSAEVQSFVETNKSARISELALRFSGKVNFPLAPVIAWIDALQRAEKKLPEHASKTCYLTKRALEQASSESTARYKATQVRGENLLNLCGGLGVDDWAFAGVFKSVVSLETDSTLNELAEANLTKLAILSIHRKNCSAEEFLARDIGHYDWIYADPDRREAGKRLVSLVDCSPDLPALWPVIQQRSAFQMIKLSPLYPLEQLEKELSGLFRIEVVSWQNEVKEVLAFCASTTPSGALIRKAVSIETDGILSFEGQVEKGQTAFPGEGGYFYEAHPALAKANLGVTYAKKCGNEILIPNGIFQRSLALFPDFFGRTFVWVYGDGYSRKKFQQYLKTRGIIKANFTCRYFKQTPEELKKAHGMDDGGEDYFFFFEKGNKEPYFIHGRKLAKDD
ncbi:MAG: THUMP-like domain-containing protein [Bacteroidia bacterium]